MIDRIAKSAIVSRKFKSTSFKKMKYKIIICDDSKDERFNFYYRQFDNFDIYGVNRINNKFVEHDPIDSIEKLYLLIRELRSKNNLPDLILLDIFYKRKIKNANELENKFIKDIKQFKNKFYTLRNEVNRYLIPSGIDLLKKIRKDDLISSFELPISSYTDKNFNFPSKYFLSVQSCLENRANK